LWILVYVVYFLFYRWGGLVLWCYSLLSWIICQVFFIAAVTYISFEFVEDEGFYCWLWMEWVVRWLLTLWWLLLKFCQAPMMKLWGVKLDVRTKRNGFRFSKKGRHLGWWYSVDAGPCRWNRPSIWKSSGMRKRSNLAFSSDEKRFICCRH